MGDISNHFKNCNTITVQGRFLKFSEVSVYGTALSQLLGIVEKRDCISTSEMTNFCLRNVWALIYGTSHQELVTYDF